MVSNGLLVLSNGMFFRGRIHGPFQATGELIFNTSMTGYQEILTDPSYCGQIVTMTAPHIGNYGNHEQEFQSKGFQVADLVCGFIAEVTSRIGEGVQHLDDQLKESGINTSNTLKPDFIWVPSIAVSGIKFYHGDAFPEWKNSLLVSSLKYQYLSVLHRKDNKFVKEEIIFKDKIGRVRDVEIDQLGNIYVIADERDSNLFVLKP